MGATDSGDVPELGGSALGVLIFVGASSWRGSSLRSRVISGVFGVFIWRRHR